MTARIAFRWAAWLLVLAIAVFTLSPIGLRPTTKAPADVERFLAFAAAGAAFFLGYPKHRFGILILLIGIIGGLEFAQNYVPGRHGRLPDGLAKLLGALIGSAFSLLVEWYWKAS